MIDIEVKRAKHGRTIKIYGRNEDQPPVTATVEVDHVHVYSHADMTHVDWIMFSDSVKNAINEISGGDWPKAKQS